MEKPVDPMDDPAAGRPERRRPLPWWVKVSIALFLVVMAALAVSQVFGIQHGPGLHGAVSAL